MNETEKLDQKNNLLRIRSVAIIKSLVASFLSITAVKFFFTFVIMGKERFFSNTDTAIETGGISSYLYHMVFPNIFIIAISVFFVYKILTSEEKKSKKQWINITVIYYFFVVTIYFIRASFFIKPIFP